MSEAKPLLYSAPPTECRRYDRIVSAALSGLASPAHMKQGLHPCLWSYSPFRTFPWALSIQSGYSYFNQSIHNSKEIRSPWHVTSPIQYPPSLHYSPNVWAENATRPANKSIGRQYSHNSHWNSGVIINRQKHLEGLPYIYAHKSGNDVYCIWTNQGIMNNHNLLWP